MRSSLVILISVFLFSCNSNGAKNETGTPKVKGDLALNLLHGLVKSDTETEYKLVANSQLFQKQLEHKRVLNFSEKGNVSEVMSYNEHDSLEYKWIYKYNEGGGKSEFDIYNAHNNLKRKIIYKYDRKGNNIEQDGYASDGRLEFTTKYVIDNNSNQVEENENDDNGRPKCKKTNEYDGNGNLTKIITKFPGSDVRNELTYSYDEKSNVREMKIYFGQDISVWAYSFESFDKVGNWLKNTCYHDNKLESTTERAIEYY